MRPDPLSPNLQAAALPFRWRGARLEVALVTRRNRRGWTLPKGNIEPGETPAESACREALEEAGLVGRIGNEALGSYELGRRLVLVFPLTVTKTLSRWREDDVRERVWLAPSAAARRLREERLFPLLAALPARHIA